MVEVVGETSEEDSHPCHAEAEEDRVGLGILSGGWGSESASFWVVEEQHPSRHQNYRRNGPN